MLGRTPKLDVVSLQNKMIAGKRGGYCLEQNMLFRAVFNLSATGLRDQTVRGGHEDKRHR